MAGDQHATHHIHNLDDEFEKSIAALLDLQQERLDIVFEEDSRHAAFVDVLVLRRDGVLVCGEESGARGGREGGWGEGIDGWDDGEEVLEFVEVGGGGGDGAVEGIEKGWVIGSEGKFGDYVAEVEC